MFMDCPNGCRSNTLASLPRLVDGILGTPKLGVVGAPSAIAMSDVIAMDVPVVGGGG